MKRAALKRKTPLARGKPIPRGKRMRRRSVKLTAEMKLYNVEKKKFLEGRLCEAHALVQAAKGIVESQLEWAEDVHHKKGRRGKLLRDQEWWCPVSRRNHDYIESNKKWAREVGLILYK